MSIKLRTIMQCPACGFKTTEQMPLAKKVLSYTCPACKIITNAAAESCCIFCQLGSLKCPEQQKSAGIEEK